MRLLTSINSLVAKPIRHRDNGAVCSSRPFVRLPSQRARRLLVPIIACAVLAVAAGTGSAAAQDAPAPIRLELNRLEPQGASCRAYLLIDNGKGEALKSFKVDLFAMDTDGVAQRRLAVEVGPVPARKTLIKLFDFAASPARSSGACSSTTSSPARGRPARARIALPRSRPPRRSARSPSRSRAG